MAGGALFTDPAYLRSPGFWGVGGGEEKTPDETALSLADIPEKQKPRTPGALAGGEAASPRLQETRWGWQRGHERTDARGAETERERCGQTFGRTPRLRRCGWRELQGGKAAGPGLPRARRGSSRPAYLLLTVCLQLGWLGLCPWSKSRESRVKSFWCFALQCSASLPSFLFTPSPGPNAYGPGSGCLLVRRRLL